MSYNSAVDLDELTENQDDKESTLNDILAALSGAAIFGIKQSVTSGLTFGVYGGVLDVAGVPTVIADQTVTLTDDATNYLYSTSAGVLTKVTSAPTGWPAISSPVDAIALYQLVVADGVVDEDNSINYIPSLGRAGTAGEQGEQGEPGTDLADNHKRYAVANGGGSTVISGFGFSNLSVAGTATARSLSSASFRESIPYVAVVTSASAGSSSQIRVTQNTCYLGNAAGRGGFTVTFRFTMESASAPANQRCYYGLFDAATGAFGNVEPDTFINIIGIGAKAGEADLSWLNNDGTGTATKSTIVSDDSPSVNFGARAVDKVYELELHSEPNSQVISATLTDLETGHFATHSFSSNIPSNSQFLTPTLWMNNGSTAAAANLGFNQMVVETPY